ncbi:Voltage-dependent anion-selective channel protein 1 [Cichlidogyrus casuarinus]|uniref:Voltage-dependent anion-selective channel protein 1 n=1 Tax=Cichlidogyrus casuarinus TaxID=1844966 RepID=A0ABD2QJE1_9PLAT
MNCNVPAYSDLGKKARDIFDKDFNTGLCNFEYKGKTCSGAEVKVAGNHDIAKSIFNTAFECKSKIACGILSKVKVDSKLNFSKEIEVSDRIVKNLKQNAILNLRADDMLKMFTLKNSHHAKHHNVQLDFFFSESCPTTVTSLVLGPIRGSTYGGITATMEPKHTRPSMLAGTVFHRYKDLQLTLSGDMTRNLYFSAFHANSVADIAVKFNWNMQESALTSAVGFLCKPYPGAFFKGKIDNNLQIGASYGVKLAEGLDLILTTSLDGRNIQQGHTLGFAIEASSP